MHSLSNSYKAIIKIILITAVLAAGFYVRAELILKWESNPDHYFVKGEPTFIELDGYYYLETAKEIFNGNYTATDNKRAYPESATRPQHPSLLSQSLAYFSKFSGVSLNWTAVFFPVVLSLFIALPLYLFSIYWGTFPAVVGSITIGVLSHYYSSKTSLGRIDTDCLNAVLPLLCAYFFMRFGADTTNRRYTYFSAGMISYLLFLWWWDMSPAAVSILSLTPLVIALSFHYRPKKNEGLIFYAILLSSVCVLFYFLGFDAINRTVQSILGLLSYISKQDGGLFPNIGLSIEEQGSFSLSTVAEFAITGIVSLVLAVCGLVILVYKKRTMSLYLLPLLVIGFFGVFFAERFLIFLTPVLAIGFGYFFSEVLSTVKQKALPAFLYALFLGYIMVTTLFTERADHTFFPGQIVQGMQEIKHVTPENAVIWSWWDEGHPLIYWAERATISDGWLHGGMLTYCTALPLSTDDHRLAANFMQFYVVRGTKGINQFIEAVDPDFETGMNHLKNVLTNGPERVDDYLQTGQFDLNFLVESGLSAKEFFFPTHAPPVFLFLDTRLLGIQRWIHWYGNWNTKSKSGTATLPTLVLKDVNFDHEGFPNDLRFSFNKQDGTFTLNGTFEEPAKIASVMIIKDQETKIINFGVNNGPPNTYAFNKRTQNAIMSNKMLTATGKYAAEFFPLENRIILRDAKTTDSLINRLFFHKNNLQVKYFEPVDISSKDYQIWRVKGEQ